MERQRLTQNMHHYNASVSGEWWKEVSFVMNFECGGGGGNQSKGKKWTDEKVNLNLAEDIDIFWHALTVALVLVSKVFWRVRRGLELRWAVLGEKKCWWNLLFLGVAEEGFLWAGLEKRLVEKEVEN